MEDLTGLGKLADSKLANQIYEDGGAKATNEAGKALEDIVKSFRLFMAPIQLMSVAQDRLAAYCDRIRSEVPRDRQIEAAPSVAGPILLELRFLEEENPITELYLNLLKSAIDRDRVDDVHPSYVKIIGHLSPDEAMILHHLKSHEIELIEYRLFKSFSGDEINDRQLHSIAQSNYPVPQLATSKRLSMFLQHLEFLNLVFYGYGLPINQREFPILKDGEIPTKGVAKLTDFGQLFVSTCEP